MKFFLSLLLLSNILYADIALVSQWLLTPPKKREGEITQERTKPILIGDILYTANLSGVVTATHRTEGYTFWQKQLEAGVEGCFSYGRSKLIVGDLKGNLYALNARDGSEAWRFKIGSEWLSAPAVLRDRVIVASGSEEVFALNEGTGKEIWHFGHRGDEKMTVRGVSPTIPYSSEVYQGFADGTFVALTQKEGKVLWQKKLRTKERFYDIDAVPYVDEQSVVVATFDGKIYHLNRMTGDTKWIHAVGSYGGFLVEGNTLYFAGLDGNFYSLNRDTGTLNWKTHYEGTVGLQPARAGEYLVFATAGDPFYVLKPETGEVVSQGRLGAGTLAHPLGSPDGWFYILSNYGNLYSYLVVSEFGNRKTKDTIPSYSAIERKIELNQRNRKDS